MTIAQSAALLFVLWLAPAVQLLAQPAAFGESTIRARFAPEADYGPFVFRADDGTIRGMSIDFLTLIAKKGGIDIHYLPARPLNEILDAARAGEVDLISSLRPTPERASYLDFSRPYVSVPAVTIGRASGDDLPVLAQLSGRRVAVGKGYAVEAFLRERYPEIQWIAVTDDTEALVKVSDGEVAAAVTDAASARFVMARKRLTGLAIGEAVGFEYSLSFAFPKDRRELGEALDDGLRAISKIERQSILDRWMPEVHDDEFIAGNEEFARIGAWIAGAGALLLAVAWLRSRRKPKA